MVNQHDMDLVGPDHASWTSLLGLLQWYEFFVSVDQTILWRRHLAWAKPRGKEIRDYTTQRFASNMVFLSLLLGADMGVLFNSAIFTTSIRRAMMNEEYSLKFFIGVIMILAAFSSIIGLVSTFTAWGMISAISDSNSHCLLRSSIGEYVVSLPSRFVVGSLYLFLLWLVLLVVEILKGPFVFFVLGSVLYTFFQVVISLSTFGRLIIDTGAMGKNRVLDPELERQLLPSGLHASLLIKATERSRRKASVLSHYNKHKQESPADGGSDEFLLDNSSLGTRSSNGSLQTSRRSQRGSKAEVGGGHSLPGSKAVFATGDKENETRVSPQSTETTELLMEDLVPEESVRSVQTWPRVQQQQHYHPHASPRSSGRGHRRDISLESVESVDELCKDIRFPRPSILNRATSNDLKEVVAMAMAQSNSDDIEDEEDDIEIRHVSSSQEEETSQDEKQSNVAVGRRASYQGHFRDPNSLGISNHGQPEDEKKVQSEEVSRSRAARRQSRLLMSRESSARYVVKEWETEEDVRNMYDVEPPPALPSSKLQQVHRGYNGNNFFGIPRSSGRRKKQPFASGGFDGHQSLSVIEERPTSPWRTKSRSKSVQFAGDAEVLKIVQQEYNDSLFGDLEADETTPLNGGSAPMLSVIGSVDEEDAGS